MPVFWKSVELEVGLWNTDLLHLQLKRSNCCVVFPHHVFDCDIAHCSSQAPQHIQDDSRVSKFCRACILQQRPVAPSRWIPSHMWDKKLEKPPTQDGRTT